MIYLAWFILLFTLIRLGVVVSNVLGRQWLQKASAENLPTISVLIPARNEEKNIQRILSDISLQSYPNFEVWVYDDLSSDKTYQVVKNFALKDERIRVVKGEALPDGWLGKNHACHRLSLLATGQYLLFLDADVRIGEKLFEHAIAHVQKHQLALLSIFPVQRLNTWGEKITVPLMNWILVSLLPLVLTRLSSRPSLSAANGQFMLFDAATYRLEQFHKVLRMQKVEDIAIARLMKLRGLKIHTILGNPGICCRMYHSWGESVQGLARSVFDFFGGYRGVALLFGLITTLGFVPVMLALPWIFTLIYFVMVLLLRWLVSMVSRQHILINLLLTPVQQVSFLVILATALWLQYRKATIWKGRNVDEPVSE